MSGFMKGLLFLDRLTEYYYLVFKFDEKGKMILTTPMCSYPLLLISTVQNSNYCRIFKPRSRRLGGFSCFALGLFLFIYLVLSGSRPKLPLTANCLHRMMSSSANYRPFLSSFRRIPPSGGFCQVSELTVYKKKWRPKGENVNSVQLGPKSFGDGRQDICKDKASNLGPAAG